MSSEVPHTPPTASKDRAIWAALGLLTILCALFGGAFLYAYRQTAAAGSQTVITQTDDADAEKGSANDTANPAPVNSIVVHVAGAVVTPGVYTLPAGSRAVDAVRAAGGPTRDADQDALNLAAPVADGDQVVVPKRSQTEPEPSSTMRTPPASPRSPSTKLRTPGEGSVNINTASAEELQRLPGIGPSMADRILAKRKEIKRFTSVEQLLDVSGIGEKKFAQIKPFVRIR